MKNTKNTKENAYKTAITRKTLSRPTKWLVDNNELNYWDFALDYGCGKGFDADFLNKEKNFQIEKYDPHFFPITLHSKYDIIYCNYVLNVIESEEDQNKVIADIKRLLLPNGIAYIAVRNDKKNLNGVTSKGTYQTHVELNLPVIEQNSNFIMYVVTNN